MSMSSPCNSSLPATGIPIELERVWASHGEHKTRSSANPDIAASLDFASRAVGDSASVQTPPRTPRAEPAQDMFTPPQHVPRTKKSQPALLQALMKNSEELVREALHNRPDLANDPFWDHRCDSPLCFAVGLKCDVAIIQLLVEHGAKPNHQDPRGNTPTKILERLRPSQLEPTLPPFVVMPGEPTLPPALDEAISPLLALVFQDAQQEPRAAIDEQERPRSPFVEFYEEWYREEEEARSAAAELQEQWCEQVAQILQVA